MVVSKICGIHFKASSIRRYFPNVSGDKFKSCIGKENGVFRWKYFKAEIDKFIQVSESNLENMLNNPESAPETVLYLISQSLKSICSQIWPRNLDVTLEHGCDFAKQFRTVVN